MKDIYWEVQFKHRDRSAGKDQTFVVYHNASDELGVLQVAMNLAKEQGFKPNGEYRVYVYKRY